MLDTMANNKIFGILLILSLVIGIFTETVKIIALISIIFSSIFMIISVRCLLCGHFLNYDEFEKQLISDKFKLDGKVYLSEDKVWYYTYGQAGLGRGQSPTKWQSIIQKHGEFFEFLKSHEILLIENPKFSEKYKGEIYCWIFLIASIIVFLGATYRVGLYFGVI